MGHSHDVKDSDANFTINPTTMEIVNNSAKNKMMQGDHNSEIYSFEITQIVEGHEMILCNEIRIHFINISSDKADQSKGVANAENIRIDSAKNMLVFEWKVSGDATKYQGSLNFRIEFACTDENNVRTYAKWTEIHKGITIGEGFDNAEGYIEEHKDILAQWKADLESEIKNYETLEKKIPTKMSQLENDIELGGKTFIINVKINTKPASADKTYDEINNAYKSGRHLICVDNYDRVYQLYEADSAFRFWTALNGDVTQKVTAIDIFKNSINVHGRYTNDYYLQKNSMSEYTPATDYSPATKLYVDTVSKKTVDEHFSKDADIVPLGQYVINSSYGTTVSGKFKMPIVGCEYQITYGDIQTRKVATNHSGNVRIGDNYNHEFIIDFISESEIIVTSAKTGMQTIHITGKTLKPTKPLVLYADAAEDYKNDTTIGDEALEAILDGRQILVRTPNADGGNYTAIFSPILTYQLPNYANEYLYLFYLRDEKQNIDLSAMGLGVIPMPIYGELKLKLSQEYNECPLI